MVSLQIMKHGTGFLCIPKDKVLQMRLKKHDNFLLETEGDTKLVFTKEEKPTEAAPTDSK